MKKFALALMVLFYGLSSSGMTISLHFCCGKLDRVSLNNRQHQQDCPMGKKAGRSKCCHDQQLSVKVQSDQPPVAIDYQVQKVALAGMQVYTVYASNPPPAGAVIVPLTSYPFPPPVPVYLMQRVFRI